MLHFESHTLSIKKVLFPMKSDKYFKKDNIYGVNFDSGSCISMQYIYLKEYTTPNQVYTSNLNFCVETRINGPLYHEICLMHYHLEFIL